MTPFLNSADVDHIRAMTDSIAFRTVAFVFMLVLAIRPQWMLYVVRGFRDRPTSRFGLTVLRVIGVISLLQIVIETIAPQALG
jgi:nucleoside recognition membrane protein YjiH